jgi:hypothetical protein
MVDLFVVGVNRGGNALRDARRRHDGARELLQGAPRQVADAVGPRREAAYQEEAEEQPQLEYQHMRRQFSVYGETAAGAMKSNSGSETGFAAY